MVIAGTLEGVNIDFILSTSHLFFFSLSGLFIAFRLSLSLSHSVLAIMTAIHIEFLDSLKVLRMRQRRAGCKQLRRGSLSRTKPHWGKAEVAMGVWGVEEKDEKRYDCK